MKEIAAEPKGEGLRIGIVRSRFNADIGRASLEACVARLAELGVHGDDVTAVSVPGALEAPLALQRLAATGQYHALIALGAVVRGETYHFEIVANESAAGVAQVALDTGVPIANGILTSNTEEQAQERAVAKGRDCAEVAVEMAVLARQIDRLHR